MKSLFTLFLSLTPFVLLAQVQRDSLQVQALDEVVLEVTKLPVNKERSTLATTLISSSKNALLEPQLSINESLMSVPGLFAQNAYNYNQDLRVSIRGFGARAAFGIRGVKLIVDGIPETTPDGQGQIDNVLVGLIDKIEVLRGPSASLYGNASGGVIYINTLDQIKEKVRLNFTSGSYGLALAQALVNLNTSNKNALLAVNYTSRDGYREHSGFQQLQTNYKSLKTLNENNKLLWQINYTHSPKAYDAGGLTKEQVQENPTAARSANLDYDVRESIDHFKTGAQLTSRINNSSFINHLYFAHRTFTGFLPFKSGGVSAFKRSYWGLGSRYQTRINAVDLELGWNHNRQIDQRKRFNNLEGIKGALQSAQDELYTNTALYLTAHKTSEKLSINSGLRADRIQIGVDNSDQRQNYLAISPSLGLNLMLSSNSSLFSRYSESFETPTLSELSNNPDGSLGFNTALDPNKAKNFEIGYKHYTSTSQLELNLFSVKSSGELIGYALENYPGRTFYKNAGATKRNGIELAFLKQWGAFSIQQSYSYSDFRFDHTDHQNQLPGIPKHNFYNRLSLKFYNDMELAFTTVYWGELYATSSNSVRVDNQFYSHLAMSKSLKLSKNKLDLKCGINNVFNATYYDNIRVNTWGGRYYEPAPKRNFYVGLRLGIN